MYIINLFEIPKWLKKAGFFKDFFDNVSKYKKGSEKWLELMSEDIFINHFKENDEIKDFNDFKNVLNVCNYLDNKLPLSFYWYAYENNENVMDYFKKRDDIYDNDIIMEINDNNYIIENKYKFIKYLKKNNYDNNTVEYLQNSNLINLILKKSSEKSAIKITSEGIKFSLIIRTKKISEFLFSLISLINNRKLNPSVKEFDNYHIEISENFLNFKLRSDIIGNNYFNLFGIYITDFNSNKIILEMQKLLEENI